MNIIIRVDSSITIGTGHVMRCITLAKQLTRKGANVSFISRENPGHSISLIMNEGFYVHILPLVQSTDKMSRIRENWELDSEETIKIIKNSNKKFDLLVVDHYGLDAKWEVKIRSYVKHIMVIDDLADRPHECDLLLDQNFSFKMRNRYKDLVPDSCIQLVGPDYVLLRDEFLTIDLDSLNRNGNVKNILIFIGGTDSTGETMKVLEAIQEIDLHEINLHVVVGNTNPHKDNIKHICKMIPNTLYHMQIKNMAELMVKADFAIGAGGTTTWERCYLKLPSLTVIIAENQYEVTNALAIQGSTISLGRNTEVDKELIVKKVNSLIENPVLLKHMSLKCSELVDAHKVRKCPAASLIMELFL